MLQLARNEFGTTEERQDAVCEFVEFMCRKESHCVVEDLDALDAKVPAGRHPSHVHLLSEMNAPFQEAVGEMAEVTQAEKGWTFIRRTHA